MKKNNIKDFEKLYNLFIEQETVYNTYVFTNGRMKEFLKEKECDFFSLTEDDFLDFFFNFIGINSINTLAIYKGTYTKFYQYAIDRGYTKKANIFEESVLLDSDTIVNYMIKNQRIYYLSNADIDFISSISNKYDEIVIRSFYSGISSINELINLKLSQFDKNENKLILEDREINISKKLSYLLNEMTMDIDFLELEGIKNQTEFTKFNKDDLFYFRISKDSEKNRREFINRRLKDISITSGVDVTSKRLYISGLLQNIYKECNNKNENLIDVLKTGNNSSVEKLNNILVKYGYNISAPSCRRMFKPYITQLINLQ